MSFKNSTGKFLGFPEDDVFTFIPDEFVFKPIQEKPQFDKDSNNVRKEKVRSSGDAKSSRRAKEAASEASLLQSLDSANSEVSSYARENILSQVLKKIYESRSLRVDKKSDYISWVTEKEIDVLFRVLRRDSEKEVLYAFRILMFIGLVRIEDFGDFVTAELYSFIESEIKSKQVSDSLKSQLINGFFTIFLVMKSGSYISGIPEQIDAWLSKLEPVVEETETGEAEVLVGPKVTVSILYGVSSLLSLISDSVERRSCIEKLIPSMIPYLTDSNKAISVAGGFNIAQCFQDFQYTDDDDDEVPYFDKADLLEIITSREQEVSKGIHKSNRQGLNVAYRYIRTAVEQNYSAEAKIDIEEISVLAQVAVSEGNYRAQTKFLNITRWDKLIHLMLLKWGFGIYLKTFLTNDDFHFLYLVDEKPTQKESWKDVGAPDPVVYLESTKASHGHSDEKKRDQAINRARSEKTKIMEGL